jgi:putative peptidoglycan lipid II flippase
VPATAGLILLRRPIVHLFFEHGHFSPDDTAATALAVLCYAVGLWAFAGVRIIVSAFYSLQDTTTPAVSAAVAVAANLLLSLLLMTWLAHAGLALATAVAAMVNGGTLIVVLNRRLGGVDWAGVGRSAGRVVLATVPVVLACVWIAGAAVWSHPAEWIAKGVMLFVGLGLSITGYVGVHALMRSEELDVIWNIVRGKLRRGASSETADQTNASPQKTPPRSPN